MSTMRIPLRFVAVSLLTLLIGRVRRNRLVIVGRARCIGATRQRWVRRPPVPSGDVPAAMLEQVIADAASGAGVDPSAVEVISAEAVTWPDGSLGCPLPDQMYTQALVPGYRVILDVDGEEMSFHASEDGDFTYCADPQEPVDDGTVDR